MARAALREDALRQRAARRRSICTRRASSPTTVTGQIAERTIDYVLRELALDGGGFASAQDADTDGVEGLTFTWAPGEGAPEELLQPFEDGRFVLRGELDEPTRAESCSSCVRRRPKPARDDKAIASWNGLLLATLAQAGRIEPAVGARGVPARPALRRRAPAPDVARRSGEGDGLPRGLRRRRLRPASSCTSRPATRVGSASRAGSRRSPSSSSRDDETGGFFQSPADGEQLVARKKPLDDHPSPSGNAMLAYVLLRLARIWGDDELERRAGSEPSARSRRAAEGPDRVRVAARRARPVPRSAPRAGDHRLARRRDRTQRGRAAHARPT